MNSQKFDLVVVGGGAAGFFAAINAAILYPDLQIVILEKSNKLLSKVKISGGGRCNVTHNCLDFKELCNFYPRGKKELYSVFSRFSVNDSINWFVKRGVKVKAEADGRMFPITDSSQTIIDCFLNETKRLKIDIWQNCGVVEINKQKDFQIKLSNDSQIVASKVIITSGGFQKEEQVSWLSNFEHRIIKPVPSLFTFNLMDKEITQLMGVSVQNATVKIEGLKYEFSGPLLVTHWGFSGPVVLKMSAFAARDLFDLNYRYKVIVKWIADLSLEEIKADLNFVKLEKHKQLVLKSNFGELPKRLWEYLLQKAEIAENLKWADVSKSQLNKLNELLFRDVYAAQGKTTYKEEFVTSGGISLSDVDMKTMQSKKVEGLYFAGEVLNIDGVTGGFNFQAAWSTAFVAAKLD